MRVVLATRSLGKVAELRAMLAPRGHDVLDLGQVGIAPGDEEEGLEVYETFEENALAKGRYYRARAGGLPVVADDSGLEVAALGGAPGVKSKRWSGRAELSGAALDAANNAKLLAALSAVEDRSARFVCVVAFCSSSVETVCRGESGGTILREPRGSQGFGYDPLFFSPELGKTFAEASAEEKARVGHRGRALHALLERLPSLVRGH